MSDPLHGERAFWHWTDLVVGNPMNKVLKILIIWPLSLISPKAKVSAFMVETIVSHHVTTLQGTN